MDHTGLLTLPVTLTWSFMQWDNCPGMQPCHSMNWYFFDILKAGDSSTWLYFYYIPYILQLYRSLEPDLQQVALAGEKTPQHFNRKKNWAGQGSYVRDDGWPGRGENRPVHHTCKSIILMLSRYTPELWTGHIIEKPKAHSKSRKKIVACNRCTDQCWPRYCGVIAIIFYLLSYILQHYVCVQHNRITFWLHHIIQADSSWRIQVPFQNSVCAVCLLDESHRVGRVRLFRFYRDTTVVPQKGNVTVTICNWLLSQRIHPSSILLLYLWYW